MPKPKQAEARDYTVSIFVKKTPGEVFDSINDVRGWWIGEIDGSAGEVGAQFDYAYKDFHHTTQKVTELVPGKKVVWQVTKSKINFVKNKNEWKDTKIVFELKREGEGTRVTFIHSGLTPAIECYGGCSGGWDFYIKKSLQSFLTTGKGVAPEF